MNVLVFTYSMSQLFMTIDVQREARKEMIAYTLDVFSRKFYDDDLPHGLQHKLAQIGEDKFPMEEDES